MKTTLKEELSTLTREELTEIKTFVLALLTHDEKPNRFIFNADAYFTRYNGGWTKTVTGLDKSKTNGYSIEGEFVKNGDQYYEEGKLYIDKGVGGSRKNHKNTYTLFTFDDQGSVIVIKVIEDCEWVKNKSNWAIQLWPSIEEFLNK
jgi:hypothetical protein